MRKFYFLVIALMIGIFPIFSQETSNSDKRPDVKKEKMLREGQQLKMKFLAQEMELKEDQKKEFFKLYNSLCEKKREAYKEAEELNQKLKETPDATEDDYKKAREAEEKAHEKAKEIDKEYDVKFADFLSQKQLFKMKEAEKEFRNKMQEMKLNKKHKKQPKPQPA